MTGTTIPAPAYLTDHPPARSQYRDPRRATVTGAIVVHTAESATDLTLPDDGAEGVAHFISIRIDAAGSYHTVVDSDSIVPVGEYWWEMYGEGTGGNRWALHLSFACKAAQWPTLPEQWVDRAILNGAQEAANMAAWVKTETGIDIPDRRITEADYRAGRPGFISHAEVDPGRRSDPGAGFPWGDFLILYALALLPDITPGQPPMPMTAAEQAPYITRIQEAHNRARPDAVVDVDGVAGELTATGVENLEQLLVTVERELDACQEALGNAEGTNGNTEDQAARYRQIVEGADQITAALDDDPA